MNYDGTLSFQVFIFQPYLVSWPKVYPKRMSEDILSFRSEQKMFKSSKMTLNILNFPANHATLHLLRTKKEMASVKSKAALIVSCIKIYSFNELQATLLVLCNKIYSFNEIQTILLVSFTYFPNNLISHLKISIFWTIPLYPKHFSWFTAYSLLRLQKKGIKDNKDPNYWHNILAKCFL